MVSDCGKSKYRAIEEKRQPRHMFKEHFLLSIRNVFRKGVKDHGIEKHT